MKHSLAKFKGIKPIFPFPLKIVKRSWGVINNDGSCRIVCFNKIATYYQYIERGVLTGEEFSISLIFHMNLLFSKVDITNKV